MGQEQSESGRGPGEWAGPLDALDVARALATAKDRRVAFACLLQRLVERFEAERGFAVFADEGGGLNPKMVHNIRLEGAQDWDAIISRTIVEDVAAKRTPVLIENALAHPLLKDHSSVRRRGIRSVMCVPMIAGGELLGVVYADNLSEGGKFTKASLEMFALVVSYASAALYSARRLAERGETAPSEDLKFLSQMAAGMAHDFNNVLAAIQMRLELLRRDDTQGKLAYNIGAARRALEAGRAVIRQATSFASLHLDVEMAQVDLCEIIRQVVERLSSRLEGARPAYDLHLALPDTVIVKGNPTQLEETVINLFSNALDAMPEGGELSVSLTTQRDSCRLSVRDTGHGMEPEVQSKVFEPFFSTKGAKGMGLGLSVARAVVGRHGGTIAVESSPGQGSVFHVCLPRVTDGGEGQDGAPPEASSSTFSST